MNFENLRNCVYDIISAYFDEKINVIWQNAQNMVKPNSPFVRLNMTNAKRNVHSCNVSTENGYIRAVESVARLQVELFTHGKRQIDFDGQEFYEDTAVSDLSDLQNYLTSYLCDDVYTALNICIIPAGDVMNTAFVLDDTYEYRAMAEFNVTEAIVESLIIGIVTFGICIGGLKLGRKFGTKLAGKASILGGVILILIGLEIFIKGVFF